MFGLNECNSPLIPGATGKTLPSHPSRHQENLSVLTPFLAPLKAMAFLTSRKQQARSPKVPFNTVAQNCSVTHFGLLGAMWPGAAAPACQAPGGFLQGHSLRSPFPRALGYTPERWTAFLSSASTPTSTSFHAWTVTALTGHIQFLPRTLIKPTWCFARAFTGSLSQ